MKKLNKKVIVVTGGNGLLGKQFIEAVSKNNCIAISADVKTDSNKNADGDFVEMDITAESSIKKAISYLDKKYGRIDALVNNAYPRNKNYGRKFEQVTYEDFSENVSTHLGGYFLCSKLFSESLGMSGSFIACL